jgi:undecaprenyl-diphosphatase
VLFAKPEAAAIFLTVNGGILLLGERYRRRDSQLSNGARIPPQIPAPAAGQDPPAQAVGSSRPANRVTAGRHTDLAADPTTDRVGGQPADVAAEHRLARIGAASALWIGAAQILALLAGISREGVTMAGGLVRGLDHEDAMRFSFLLSTPVILAAGLLKVPDLLGPLGNGIRGQVAAGGVAAVASSLFAVLFLARYFRTRTLTPFAVYCAAAGIISIVRFAVW